MTQTLHAGEMIWLPPSAQPKFTVEDEPEARLILISFKN
jgi:quercetin dioxygenase-like cupin family protein